MYAPTITEVAILIGSFGLFFTCYFLFAKYFPVVAVHEIKFILKTSGDNYKRGMEQIDNQSTEDFIHIATTHHDEEHLLEAPHH